MTLNAEELRSWIGRSQTEHDLITPAPLRMLRATLDLPEIAVSDVADNAAKAVDATKAADGAHAPDGAHAAGGERGAIDVPPLWHWLYFLPSARQSQLGEDGHPARGGFLPPVPLPRRMWAGGQLEFFDTLKIGDTVSRTSTIDDVALKSGRTGDLCFVKVRHEVKSGRGLALREFHDIVYRPNPQAAAPAPAYETAPAQSQLTGTVTPDAVLLFRYSALTFNGHRIHYDRKYVTEVEGYPGLIVHGPLMATLLAGLGTRMNTGRRVKAFSFRAIKPVFDLHPFEVCGAMESADAAALWIRDHEGHAAMRATISFEPQ